MEHTQMNDVKDRVRFHTTQKEPDIVGNKMHNRFCMMTTKHPAVAAEPEVPADVNFTNVNDTYDGEMQSHGKHA